MTGDVFFGEGDKPNAMDTLEDARGLLQPGRFTGWKIDLSRIAGDDGFGAVSEPRKKHFHLLRGCILRLVENYKRIVQSSTTHERQRSDFYRPSFDQLPRPVKIYHIV